MIDLVGFLVVGGTAFILNVGAGRLRARSPKYSLAWLLYIHVPVLAIIPLRQWFALSMWTIPLLVALSVVGQVVGGWNAATYQKD